MQTKNTTKIGLLLFLTLLVAEGVFGVGLYWIVLLSMKSKRGAFWVAFACGLFLSSLYSQPFGLMSLFLVMVLALCHLLLSSTRGIGKWILLISLVVNFGFDRLFGLQWGLWELVSMIIFGLFVTKNQDSQETIKINY